MIPTDDFEQLPFGGFYRGKKVLVTGHTGFKGSWLCEWLLLLGAQVSGYSLAPPTDPSLFDQLGLQERVDHRIGDVRDRDTLSSAIREIQPDVVFHLAAQSLVRQSYTEPVETYTTNVLGTVHLLQALRDLEKSCAAVFITSDKCYENREWYYGYREDDTLGGYDPYSSSKACAEVAIQSFRRSFFGKKSPSCIAIASSRAGNVIGGGDWATDRILPDCIRALSHDEPIAVRNPTATRPWQHVLEPLSGYLLLAQKIYPSVNARSEALRSAFNFGPKIESNHNIKELVEEVLKHWPGRWEDHSDPNGPHEAGLLHLNIDKAWHYLRWHPVWSFEEAVEQTVTWYRLAHECDYDSKTIREESVAQIVQYMSHAKSQSLEWMKDT
jgi:CDP-glucose 4,6-dehydratase